jgi:hypothetical protein
MEFLKENPETPKEVNKLLLTQVKKLITPKNRLTEKDREMTHAEMCYVLKEQACDSFLQQSIKEVQDLYDVDVEGACSIMSAVEELKSVTTQHRLVLNRSQSMLKKEINLMKKMMEYQEQNKKT